MYDLVYAESANVVPVKFIPSLNQTKVPQVQYPQFGDPNIDFQFQSYKLVQANTILTQLIRQAINDKYTISEKIIKVNQHIKKLEAKNIK